MAELLHDQPKTRSPLRGKEETFQQRKQSNHRSSNPVLQTQQNLAKKYEGLPVKDVVYSNGATYTGQVDEMNLRHGKGILTFNENKAVYDGFFDEGAMTEGRITYPKAECECWFEGTFTNGQWDKGKYKRGPAIYEGTFDNQRMNGYFKVEWEGGIRYEGQVRDNRLHGEGEMIFSDGNVAHIRGEWKEDVLDICSSLVMRDGSTATNYVPSEGKLIGPGVVKVGQSTYSGIWDESGRLQGQATISNDRNQGSFQGMFKDNLRHGEGTYIWPNNQGEYKGMYQNGLRHTGEDGPDAIMVWRLGESEHLYEGKFEEGQCTLGTLDGNKVDQRAK